MKKGKLTICHPDAAGIDVGSEKHYVAIPDDDRSQEPVRSFNSFTNDLHELAQWLISCGIDTVAMESTGIYWIQLYLILESYGLKVYLVNAQHVKNVPGRKSDVADCQWIQELHTYGLLRASFQPDDLTRELRTYLRHRKSLTQGYSKQVLLMQKAFEQMNIKLHDVIADITGKTGQQIIQAILSGNRKPESLVTLVDHRVKASKEDIIKSLTGIWLEEHLFELRQAYELYHVYKDKINDCDLQIEKTLKKMDINHKPDQQAGKDNEKSKNNTKKNASNKNSFSFSATHYLDKILGTNITQIFGIGDLTAVEIIAETGVDMSKWPTSKHFVSWLNLSPNNRSSGKKKLRSKKNKHRNKAGQAFMMAASTIQRSEHWLSLFYRRIKSKKGPSVAVKATARKLAIIFYNMIIKRAEFNPLAIDSYNEKYKEQKMKYIIKQADLMGFKLEPIPVVS